MFTLTYEYGQNSTNQMAEWAQILLQPVIPFIIIAIFMVFAVLFLVLLERKVLALFTLRYGPNRVGKFGIFQTIADAIKLLLKENSCPKNSDKILFFIAPIVAFVPIMTAYAFIPMGEYFIPLNSDVGAIIFLALTSIPLIGIFLAGYSSKNKYALIGSFRAVAQALSYEIPLGISVLSVLVLAQSMDINKIILAQGATWNFIPLALGCIVFFICMLALLNRTPFDLSEAESELVGGYNVEYSGMKFALFFFSEYAMLFLSSMFFVCIFWGGYLSPFKQYLLASPYICFEQIFWLFSKSFIVILFAILVRATLPRMKFDKLLQFAYKVLIPLSLVNLALALFFSYFKGIGQG